MSKTKTNAEMLVTIKGYNKVARETKAKKEGFTSSAQMIAHLEGQIHLGKGHHLYSPITGGPCPTTKAPVTPSAKTKSSRVVGTVGIRPVIHVIDVLDSSGSMYGTKIDAAVKGINIGVGGLKSDVAEVDYTYTLCDFSEDIIFRHTVSQLSSVMEFKGETRGSTALFDAIGRTIDVVKPYVKAGEKVLVNIYTDGQENSSRHFTADAINTLIKSLSEVGWTFTFIGTAQDVAYAQARLSIKDSNTLVYDGTGAGLEKSFVANTASRSAYSQKVSAGEDVSEGFYKDIN